MLKIIRRDILSRVRDHLNKKEISLIIGPRQVGKTTLLRQLQRELDQRGQKTLYLNLDFDQDQSFFATQEALIKKLRLVFGSAPGTVFIDEIQRRENAGLFLKGLHDHDLPHKFIVSGSGSLELKEKIGESLSGRKRIFEMLPVTFSEFVNFRTSYQFDGRLAEFFAVETGVTQSLLEEYLAFGGYPKIITTDRLEEKTAALREIISSYLERDISIWLKVDKLEGFSQLLKILASQCGRLINYSELANTLDLSMATVKNYLWYLEKTFIIKRLSPFSRNARHEITKAPIVYFHDLGWLNYFRGQFGQPVSLSNQGFTFQDFVFQILNECLGQTEHSLYHWRTKAGAEVDFVVTRGLEPIPVEVKCQKPKNFSLGHSLSSFIKTYTPKQAWLVNLTMKKQLTINKTKVFFTPYWELPGQSLQNR